MTMGKVQMVEIEIAKCCVGVEEPRGQWFLLGPRRLSC